MVNKWTENQLYILQSNFSVIGRRLFWGDVCEMKWSNVKLKQQDVHHMFGLQTTGPGNGDNSHPTNACIIRDKLAGVPTY